MHQSNSYRLQWKYLLYLGVVLIDFILFMKLCFPAAEINQFLIRDIARSKEILLGHFIAVGPDFTSGTYAPGPFYYFILAPIVLFTQKASMVLIYLFSLKLVIQFFFCRALEKIFKTSFFFFYFLLSASPLMVRAYYWPNNAALIIPLGQLLSLFACWYYLASPKKQIPYLILTAIAWGLFLQVHFSFFLVAPLLFFLIGEKTNSPKGRATETGIFLFFSILPLVPFLVASLRAGALNNIEGPVFYVHDFGLSFFFKAWGLQVGRTFTGLPEIDQFKAFYGLIFFYTILRGIWILFSKKAAERNFFERIFLYLTLLTFLMSAWILSGRMMRYYSLLYSLSYLILVIDLGQIVAKTFKTKKVEIIFAGLLFSLSWASLFSFYSDLGLQGRCENCILQREKICDFMNRRGVSYQEFARSTYELLEEFNEGSADLTKDCFDLQEGQYPVGKFRYLIAHSYYSGDGVLPTALVQLPLELRGIYTQERLKTELATPGFTLYSVALKDSELASYPRVTNLAYFYEIDPAFGEKYYLTKMKDTGARLSRALICSTPLFCDLFVKDSFVGGQLRLEFNSRVFQTKYDLDPVAARVRGLNLKYLCDGRPGVLPIVSTLGASNGKDQNSSFFTPLVTEISLPCKSVELTSILVDQIDLFYTKTGMDHLSDQEYRLQELN